MAKTFNQLFRERLNNYISTVCGGVIDGVARIYATKLYGKEKGLTAIKKMLKDEEHIFTEDELKIFCDIMNAPSILHEYYVSQINILNAKVMELNGGKPLQQKQPVSTPTNSIVDKKDVMNAIQNYTIDQVESPMLVLCDNCECIEYLISKANIEAVITEKHSYVKPDHWERNIIDGYNFFVCTLELKKTMAASEVIERYQRYKNVISDHPDIHVIIIVAYADELQKNLLFKTFSKEPHIITYKSDPSLLDAVAYMKEHPQEGVGWGYGTLLNVYQTSHIKSPSSILYGEYACWHKDYGLTFNYGKAVAKRVRGLHEEHFRTFASIFPAQEVALGNVGSNDPFETNGGVRYTLDRHEIVNSSGVKPEYSWFASEFTRAKENTIRLAKKNNRPAVMARNYKVRSFPELQDKWYLPSLVELVVAKKDLKPGLYCVSFDLFCNGYLYKLC